jgi:hypothetical protein
MENEEKNMGGKAKDQDHKHHTWIESLTENIQKLDTEFPLSGGETEEDLEKVEHAGEGKEEEHHKTSFFEDLDTEFPLSGGEVER